MDDDVWTNNSIEYPCDKCGDRVWFIFQQDGILYGDCASCEQQQELIVL